MFSNRRAGDRRGEALEQFTDGEVGIINQEDRAAMVGRKLHALLHDDGARLGRRELGEILLRPDERNLLRRGIDQHRNARHGAIAVAR